jgi:hypothetical protein
MSEVDTGTLKSPGRILGEIEGSFLFVSRSGGLPGRGRESRGPEGGQAVLEPKIGMQWRALPWHFNRKLPGS